MLNTNRNTTMNIAFSTIACPSWTLEEAASRAADFGYLGVELRSFHDGSVEVASEPFGCDPEQIKAIFEHAGVEALSFATSVRYDTMINPPVIGRVFLNEEEGVGDTKAYVDLADRSAVPFVRVFGNSLPAAEPRTWSMRRVSERLKLAAQTARNTEVRLLIENAGAFSTSEALLELLELVDSQWLEVSYNTLAAVQAGECPMDGLHRLMDWVKIIKINDVDDDGYPVLLGDGRLPLEKFVKGLVKSGFDGWLVYEYPKLWMIEDERDPAQVLKHAADTLYGWMNAEPSACGCACSCSG